MKDDEVRLRHGVVPFLHVVEKILASVRLAAVGLMDETGIHGQGVWADEPAGRQSEQSVVEQRRENRAGFGKHSEIGLGRGSNPSANVLKREIRRPSIARRSLDMCGDQLVIRHDSPLDRVTENRENSPV